MSLSGTTEHDLPEPRAILYINVSRIGDTLLVTPAVVAWGARGTALNGLDWVATGLFLGCLLLETIADSPVPVLALIRGGCLGAGVR